MRSSFLLIVLVSVLLCGSSFAGENVAPVVDAGGPYEGVIGEAVAFDASGTTDPEDDSLMYLWNFGDGSPPQFPSLDPTTSHVYTVAGTYTVVLTVTDGINNPVTATTTASISVSVNLPPVVDAGGPYVGVIGDAVIFDASGTTDPEDDSLVYLWNFGDGSSLQFPSQNPITNHVYTAAGTYTVVLTVTDGINDPVSVEVIAMISVDNLPPVVDSGGPYSGFVGETIEFDCSGTTDPDGDTLTYLWDFGDGSPPQFPSQVPTTSHIYNNAGSYTAMLSVADSVNDPVVVSFSVSVEVPSGIIYVDGSALGRNNGSTWRDAYNYLADGLRAGRLGDSIWVGEGFYRPGENKQNGGRTEDRRATFSLIEGVSVYGGFPSGGGEWEDRDAESYATVLSGDIGERDVVGDNCYNVIDVSRTEGQSILDGLTITAGNANSDDFYYGGGMVNDGGYPVLVNCRFVWNRALFGGGMYNGPESRGYLINCSFIGNRSEYEGGGVHNSMFSRAKFVNCLFSANVSLEASGGGMWNDNCDSELINCTISGNHAKKAGGGIFNSNESYPQIANCIVWGNVAGGEFGEIAQIANYKSWPEINYCCVEGWKGDMGGEGNIGIDPLFKDADGSDDVPGTMDDNLQLAGGSPCIDAGSNVYVPMDGLDLDGDGAKLDRVGIDLAGNERFTDDPATVDTGRNIKGYPSIVEMGAYERYEFCGSGAFPYPPGDLSGPGDLRDCRVDMFDLAVIAANWLEDTGPE